MSTEWTIVTLKEHLEALMAARNEQIDRRSATAELRFQEHIREVQLEGQFALEASEKSIAKFETSIEKRFDAINNFRQQLADQQAEFLTRGEYSVAHQALEDNLAAHAHDDEVQHQYLADRIEAQNKALTDKIDALGRSEHSEHVQLGAAIQAGVNQGIAAREELQKTDGSLRLEVSELRTQLRTTSANRVLLISIIGLLLTMMIIAVSVYAAVRK